MPTVRKNEPLPQSAIIVLIYGPHGVAKTSLALTTKNPYHLDFDKGLKRAAGKADALAFDPKNPTNLWKEAEDLVEAGFFAEFDTIIIDTIKAGFDDFIKPLVEAEDFKAKKDPRKAFGLAGERFVAFANKVRNQGKDLYLICHSKSVEDGDITKNVCDITGNVTPAYVLRCADQIGYLSVVNGQRTITFNPTDINTGKNTAELPALILPYYTDVAWTGFAEREISQKLREKFATMDEAQRQAIDFISGWQTSIDAILPEAGKDDITANELVETLSDISKITEEHIKKQVRKYFQDHLKKIEWKWVDSEKVFKPKPAPAAAQPEPEASPVVQTPEKAAAATSGESNPAALIPPPSTPKINGAAVAAEEQKEDLFAPAPEGK